MLLRKCAPMFGIAYDGTLLYDNAGSTQLQQDFRVHVKLDMTMR